MCSGDKQSCSTSERNRNITEEKHQCRESRALNGVSRASQSHGFEEAGGEEAQLSSGQRQQQQQPGLLSCWLILEEDWSHPGESLRALV